MVYVLDEQLQVISPPTTGLESAVGNTPLFPLQRLNGDISPRVQVFGKAEWFNPGGSVKARPALSIIQSALEDGCLGPEKRLLDSTSGNMGIAYATFGASFGIPITLAIPANASPERIKILRALGAELVLTDPLEGTDGAIRMAQQMAEGEPQRYFFADQYNNPANWRAHFNTTGPEIVYQTAGRISHFVAGMGTAGTLTGTARNLRQFNPQVEIIAVQPDGPFHGLEGLKHMPTALQPGIYDASVPDRVLEISTETAYAYARALARQEGLFVGVSAGAAAAAAMQVALSLDEGTVVTILPDAGYKYLSENIWEQAV
jgi:cysteine synthase B